MGGVSFDLPGHVVHDEAIGTQLVWSKQRASFEPFPKVECLVDDEY
jgi:hypothetical protein